MNQWKEAVNRLGRSNSLYSEPGVHCPGSFTYLCVLLQTPFAFQRLCPLRFQSILSLLLRKVNILTSLRRSHIIKELIAGYWRLPNICYGLYLLYRQRMIAQSVRPLPILPMLHQRQETCVSEATFGQTFAIICKAYYWPSFLMCKVARNRVTGPTILSSDRSFLSQLSMRESKVQAVRPYLEDTKFLSGPCPHKFCSPPQLLARHQTKSSSLVRP